MSLTNKVALITGAISGIGLCCVKEFLRNGVKGVTLADVNVEKGKEILSLLEKEFGSKRVIFVKVDVSNQDEFEDAFKKTIEAFGNIDILVNNAGILDERDFKRMVDINVNGVIIGTFLAMENYLPKYKTYDDPVVVNISSLYGLDPSICSPKYTATKYAVLGLGRSLSDKTHFEPTGVKILTICPGLTETAIVNDIYEKHPPGRYVNILNNFLPTINLQKPEVLSLAMVKILENFQNGDVWLVEDNQCHLLDIPSRFDLKKKKTFSIETC
ncbi:short chain dehydrogenase [Popillia japonica]|uniref:Short chain dehydrogenase n=1 Tax=Popillia japonica TaxID=7064 RepID=A0AAW1JVW4_POPJA